MKKILGFMLIFAGISFVSAQNTVKRNIGDFNSINIYDCINIKLVRSDENKIEIIGDRAEEVLVNNKSGNLKIYLPAAKMLSGSNTNIVLYYKKVDNLEVSEGAVLSSEKSVESDNISMVAREGGKINLEIKTKNLEIKVNSGGSIELSGETANQDILITSGGILEAKNLKSNKATITVNAGGKADITATDFVDAKIRAGGNINIHGKPETLKKKITAGGKINVVK